jgi:hypothetical protein
MPTTKESGKNKREGGQGRVLLHKLWKARTGHGSNRKLYREICRPRTFNFLYVLAHIEQNTWLEKLCSLAFYHGIIPSWMYFFHHGCIPSRMYFSSRMYSITDVFHHGCTVKAGNVITFLAQNNFSQNFV